MDAPIPSLSGTRGKKHLINEAVRRNMGHDRPLAVVVREFRRDPQETTYTFTPRLRVVGRVDVVELLDRCDDTDLTPHAER